MTLVAVSVLLPSMVHRRRLKHSSVLSLSSQGEEGEVALLLALLTPADLKYAARRHASGGVVMHAPHPKEVKRA
jgi:hypothetical protein